MEFTSKKKAALTDRRKSQLAAKTAQLAENLPDRAAVGVTVGIATKEKHLADLLVSICLAGQLGL